jgi:class 3 adenylate cyclase
VTVLFTDIVDSTALRQTLGDDRYDEIRRAHDAAVRDAITAHGGTEVKALGDGFMVVFAAAAEGVSAAVAIEQAVDRLAHRRSASLEVRVGLSAGDVVREGDDYFGSPVDEAARLCDEAGGGQILVNEVVRLLAGSRGAHRYQAVGALALRGIAEPVTATEVLWESDAGTGLPPALTVAEQVAFVGRSEPRARLLAAWKRALGGEVGVAFVSGEPGVGKTRLAAEIARSARDDSGIVLYGRCDADLGVPYQPFVEALRAYVENCPIDELAAHSAPYAGDLARLVPSLADRLDVLPEPLLADAETERARQFEAVTLFLAHIAATAPVLLVLDDLHWGAKPTLLLLRHLARTDAHFPLLIIGTYRDTELGRAHPLADMLADLRRDTETERVQLHGLDADEVVAFLAAASGHPLDATGEALARRVHTETEGNPFFLSQVFNHLAATGAMVSEDGRWVAGAGVDTIGIPEGVREVVGRRLATLSEEANDTLALAAVVGREFDHDVLVAAGSHDTEAVLDALEEAEGAHLIMGVEDHAGRYTFVHALVRSTLYDEIATTRRLRLHRSVAEAIEATRGDARLGELAYHYSEAAALGLGDKAVDYGRRAAREALDRLAYEEAAVHYERALGGLDPDRSADDPERAALFLELGRTVFATGERARAWATIVQSAELARRIGEWELFAQAALAYGGERGWNEVGKVDDQLVELLQTSLDNLPPEDSPLRARVSARLSSELYFNKGSAEQRYELSREAIDMARRIGDPETLVYTLNTARWGAWRPDNPGERSVIAHEALALAEQTGNRSQELNALTWLALDLGDLAEIDAVRAAVARATTIAEELRRPDLRWVVTTQRAALALLEADFDRAAQLADDALALGQQAEIQSAMQMYGIAQFEIRRVRGGVAELEPLILSMIDEYPALPAWRTALPYLRYELGDADAARAELEAFVAQGLDTLPLDGNWDVAMAILARVSFLVGARDHAAELYDLLAPFSGRLLNIGMPAAILGSTDHFLALAAATSERWHDFERHAEIALARNESIGAWGWLATAQLELGTILLARDARGDDARAQELLDASLRLSREFGMPVLADRARRAGARDP